MGFSTFKQYYLQNPKLLMQYYNNKKVNNKKEKLAKIQK
jgi:hypothetical protein